MVVWPDCFRSWDEVETFSGGKQLTSMVAHKWSGVGREEGVRVQISSYPFQGHILNDLLNSTRPNLLKFTPVPNNATTGCWGPSLPTHKPLGNSPDPNYSSKCHIFSLICGNSNSNNKKRWTENWRDTIRDLGRMTREVGTRGEGRSVGRHDQCMIYTYIEIPQWIPLICTINMC
jgi:hypothetical protein